MSRLILHQCGLVGCRVGEASNPGPVLPSSDDEPVSALVLPSTQPASVTLPTWADSDRPHVDEPGRNVRPRLRVRSVSPTILDALEEDLEVNAVSALRRDDEEGLDEIGVTQVDQGSSFFDMTVADSPEDDVPPEVSRRRRRSRRRVMAQRTHPPPIQFGGWFWCSPNNQPQSQHQDGSTQPQF